MQTVLKSVGPLRAGTLASSPAESPAALTRSPGVMDRGHLLASHADHCPSVPRLDAAMPWTSAMVACATVNSDGVRPLGL